MVEASRARTELGASAQPVAAGALDADGRLTSWNAEAERLYGWSAAEVLGRVPPTVPEE